MKFEEVWERWSPEDKEAFIMWATSQITCPFCKTELGLPTSVNVFDALGGHIGKTEECKAAIKSFNERNK